MNYDELTQFEISKVYTIRLQRYRAKNKFKFLAQTQILWSKNECYTLIQRSKSSHSCLEIPLFLRVSL